MDSKEEYIYNRKFYNKSIVFLLRVLGVVLLRDFRVRYKIFVSFFQDHKDKKAPKAEE